MIKYIYALFLGLILTVFVGIGIETFYPSPTAPDYPTALSKAPADLTPAEQRLQDQYDQQNKDFMKALSTHNRNASMVALGFAVLWLVVSLLGAARLQILAEGFLVGGVFTLVYSIGTGMAADSMTYRFLVVTVGLLIALFLGYVKFLRPASDTAGAK